MNYPLQLRFKILALAPQIFVRDARGATICYVKQKLFRFREKVEVFADDSRHSLLGTIQADRILDFSANYAFQMQDGSRLGSVRRRGLRSIWRAHYEILDDTGAVAFVVREENPVAKLVDSMLGQIPIVGLFTGLVCHPRYLVSRNGIPVAQFTKGRALLESYFTMEKLGDLDAREELRIVLSLIMFVLLERSRG
ncbi:MAG: hypothetical protein ACOYMN_15045 [Roseimicrobium sp.]